MTKLQQKETGFMIVYLNGLDQQVYSEIIMALDDLEACAKAWLVIERLNEAGTNPGIEDFEMYLPEEYSVPDDAPGLLASTTLSPRETPFSALPMKGGGCIH